MIEPTESEGKHELDRFVDAMLTIREEIQEIADGACVSQHARPIFSVAIAGPVPACTRDTEHPRGEGVFDVDHTSNV